jgi:hypothetical protein
VTKKNGADDRQFIKLYRDVLESAAWRSLNLYGYRLVNFLMIEDMRHGGRQNGFLLAPYRQLEAFGIHKDSIARTIDEVERVGLIDCIRGGHHVPNRYALTWRPLADGTPPSERWRYCSEQADELTAARRLAKTRAVMEQAL